MIRQILAACAILTLIVIVSPVLAGKFNRKLDVGDAAPVWKDLPGVDEQQHSLADYKDAKVLVVAFTCNHCPVANAYELRFRHFVQEYKPKGVEFVAISVSHEPSDSLEKMKRRAVNEDYNFDYLQDLSQESGAAYGATVTPHVFVLDADRKIAYMGAFDDNWASQDGVENAYVRDAVDALLAGKQPEVTESRQTGCGIEYVKQ